MKRRVVVTGMGVVTPIGNDVKSFWDNLLQGVSGVGYVSSFDTEGYATKIGAEVKGFDPNIYFNSKEINRMDKFTQYGVVAARQAIEEAKLTIDKIDPYRIGTMVGSGAGGMNMLLNNHKKFLDKGPRAISVYVASGILINSLSNEIAIRIGAKAKSGAFVTACATAANCIGEGMRAIQHDEADIMIVGGVEGDFTQFDVASFSKMRALSTRNDSPQGASRPFDKNRDGFVIGTGGGVLVLESEEFARKRGANILAELSGYGTTTDAYHITAPDGKGMFMAMKLALKEAGLMPNDLDYINAHGTSTKLNDYCETMAIKKMMGEKAKSIPVSSIKSMIGHLLGGAGAVELIASILTLKEHVVPPTINYKEQDEGMDLNYVPNEAQVQKVNAVMSNSFGFGGHNTCLVVKKYNK
ncbi:beta-ketoacyl-ACP synthase II [Bacillus cytotoxicus]|uniref:beta-ketoacyl-ACP synthase II n=1 Tax=Bacillus cereus group sp. BfR-BA-01492 TaxID=2920361 RepID=UPI001F56EAF7|nr:beta-ketoacyl-ACP synthase II [Bacillus cereus group sp. BfR-BA-01492]EMA6342462.1 beta-ketoacyl-ACP synthase II [Bacillus cytotoxicus]